MISGGRVKVGIVLGAKSQYFEGMDRTARAAEDHGFAGLWTSETQQAAFLPLAIAANDAQRMDLGKPSQFESALGPMAEGALASGSPDFNPRQPSREKIIALYREVY
jgi:alcohol dehydrogenase class IV